jgi:hypothetical protein
MGGLFRPASQRVRHGATPGSGWSNRASQLQGIEMPCGLGTASTKTKLIFVGPGMFPGLFISNEPNLYTG